MQLTADVPHQHSAQPLTLGFLLLQVVSTAESKTSNSSDADPLPSFLQRRLEIFEEIKARLPPHQFPRARTSSPPPPCPPPPIAHRIRRRRQPRGGGGVGRRGGGSVGRIRRDLGHPARWRAGGVAARTHNAARRCAQCLPPPRRRRRRCQGAVPARLGGAGCVCVEER